MHERAEAIKVESQELDMTTGELTTTLTFPMSGGQAEAKILQFISRSVPSVSCQEVQLTVPASGTLEIDCQVVTGPGNLIYMKTPPHHENVTDIMLGYEPPDGRSRCGVAVKVDFGRQKMNRHPFEPDSSQTTRTYTTQVEQGQTITIRSTAGTVSSIYHPEPQLEACRLVNYGALIGFDRLREMNRQEWSDIWKSRIIVSGDDTAQQYLDAALFYTFSSVHRSCRTSMPPFGTSQVVNYFGHVFWDTDTYTTPALMLIDPETARMTIEYRRANLEAAIKQAQSYGYRGAMYPWESATTGEEATPSTVPTGWAQQHVNMCVAIAAWQYQLVAGDLDHARQCTWPIMREVARWITSRVEHTDRGYELRDTMSSHEGATLHNSCYVNGIAAKTLRDATSCARLVGYEPDPQWQRIADQIFIATGPAPEETGIKGDIIYMHDQGWIEEGASVDMFMIGFPFDLPFDRNLLERTYQFYHQRPQEKLSMGVVFKIGHAAFLGDRQWQRVMFDRVTREKWEKPWRMGLEYSYDRHTCFVTTQAGMLQTALMGMTGIRFNPDDWTKYPACLPEGWSKIECGRIYLGNEAYRIEAVSGQEAQLTPLD
jgi:trehalose/maltose hydrolase-like predicted phosphorylase